MSEITITPEMKKIIDEFIRYGVEIKRQSSDLRESFNERLKEVAEKTQMDKKILRKMVKYAYEMEKANEDILKKEEEAIDLIRLFFE